MTNERRGRVRSEAAWQAILGATRDELAAQGYDRLSIDRIATAAGVGKQTVYRWYPSKNALVADCILRGYVIAPTIDTPDSGDVRRDVRGWLDVFARESRTPLAAALVRAGSAAAAEDAEVAARYDEVTARTMDALADRFRGAVAAGQLPADSPVTTMAEALVGTLLYRVLTRQDLSPAFLDDLVRIALGPDRDDAQQIEVHRPRE